MLKLKDAARMKSEKASKHTQRFSGHRARAAAMAARRLVAAVIARRPLPRVCPLTSSMRLNSSSRVFFSHRCHRRRSVSAGGAPRAARPVFVSASLEPRTSASRAACTSHGQANALTGPATCSHRCSFFSFGSKKSPPSSTSPIRRTAAAEACRVLALAATLPWSMRRSTASRSRGAARSMSRRTRATVRYFGVLPAAT